MNKKIIVILFLLFSISTMADSYRGHSFDDVVMSHESIIVAEITLAKAHMFESSEKANICGYSYKASKIKSLKGGRGALLEFSSIKPLELTKKYLLFVSSKNPNRVIAASSAGKDMPDPKKDCLLSLPEKYVTSSPTRSFQFSSKLIDRKEWIIDKQGDAVFPSSVLERRVVVKGGDDTSIFFGEIFRLIAWEELEREIEAVLVKNKQSAVSN